MNMKTYLKVIIISLLTTLVSIGGAILYNQQKEAAAKAKLEAQRKQEIENFQKSMEKIQKKLNERRKEKTEGVGSLIPIPAENQSQ